MQTFLPYERFNTCANVLDDKRLGKQCEEVNQILNAALGLTLAWENHPCVKMWRGYEFWLWTYGWAMNKEWHKRFGEYRLAWYLLQDFRPLVKDGMAYPHWLGDDEFHLSHRSNLARKSEHYAKQWPYIPKDLPYVWPTALTQGILR